MRPSEETLDLTPYFGRQTRIPPRTDLISVLRHWSAERGNETAFYFVDGQDGPEQSLTFGELDIAARRVAGYLQRLGAAGQRVLLLYPPAIDFVVGFFGCLYAGATAVPAFPPRKNRKGQRIHGIARDCQSQLALTNEQVRQQIEGDSNWVEWESISIIATDSMTDCHADAWKDPHVLPDDLAVLQYTSGSTGHPKGVMLKHANLVRNTELIMVAFDTRQDAVGMSWLPTYHDMGLVGGILMPVFLGRPCVLMSPMTFLQQPIRWFRAITRYGGTITGAPNFAYQLCVDKITDDELDGIDLSTWCTAFNGAEPVRSSTIEQFTQRFSRVGFNQKAFLPCYGMAETTLIVTGGPHEVGPIIRSFDAASLDLQKVTPCASGGENARALVACGHVLPGEKIYVVEPKSAKVLAENVIGEIWVQSPSVGQGYWEKEEATRETFRAYTAAGEGPFLKTGDLGFIHDGQLYIAGRLKDMIIVRGVNRYPQDIELTVEQSNASMQSGLVAAFAINSDDRERLIVAAEVNRKVGDDWSKVIDDIRRSVALQHELPPDAVYLVRFGTLPRTSSGKIQRHACKQQFLAGSLTIVAKWASWDAELPAEEPMIAASTLSTTTVSGSTSSTADEGKLRGGKLQLDHEIIDVVMDSVRAVAQERAKNLELDTNLLLDLGLDSLERMQIAHALEQTFGGRFPEQVLQEIETVREVATAIEKHIGKAKLRRDLVPTETGLTADKLREIAAEDYCFDQLPEFRKLKRMMGQFELTGVPNPYFSVHQGITRDTTRIGGRELVSFASYNYLGMSGDPEVTQAVIDAVKKYGTSVSASRLVSGEKEVHGQLESEIAQWVGTDAAVVMVGGHATNETTIGHLVGPGDLIVHDALSHNSIVQGAVLSGARRRPFPHNDWQSLETILEEVRSSYRRVLVILEGVYSMDGDYPDLPKFVAVKRRHKSWLMIDEAHSMGTMGTTGRGIGEHFGINSRDVDIWMGTLSKSFGSCGGYIAGSKELIELLRYTAPGFVFSVGLSPTNAAAALASLRVLRKHPERIARLHELSALFLREARRRGLNTGNSHDTPVIPVITGNSMHALLLSRRMFEKGFNVQPILYPAVEESAARLRFFINCTHCEQQILSAVECVEKSLRDIHPAYFEAA